MRFITLVLVVLLSITIVPDAAAQERVKPFVLAAQSEAPFEEAVITTREKLESAGFAVIGDYRPYESAAVLVVTNDSLKAAAKAVDTGAWAAALRVAVTGVDDTVQISFANPVYLAIAYRLEDPLTDTRQQLTDLLGYLEDFGSDKGMRPKALGKYRYMFGMERVDDVYKLGTFDTQDAALDAVEAGLGDPAIPASKVYRLDLDESTTLFGVAMSGEGDEAQYHDDAFQMSIVDFHDLKGTAYLPYEIRVQNGVVTALHMRYRMAVHYPDLSMMGKHSFMTLRPSPGAIELLLKSVVSQTGDQ